MTPASFTPWIALLVFFFEVGTAVAQDKALEVQENSDSYQIRLLADIFLPFSKSCSVKVTLPSSHELWAEVLRSDPIIRLPKAKVTVGGEVYIRGSQNEYNGKRVLPCLMMPAKIAIGANVETGTSLPSGSGAVSLSGVSEFSRISSAESDFPSAQSKALTISAAQSIHREVQSRHIVLVSKTLVGMLEKNFEAGKAWHHLLIDVALEGDIPMPDTKNSSKQNYQISDETRKEYFDAILNQDQNGPWALAVAPDGCASSYQSKSEWNSKWTALRKCKKACQSEECKILYINKTPQELTDAQGSGERVDSASRQNLSLKSIDVITLFYSSDYQEKLHWPRANLIFSKSGRVIASFTYFDSDKKKWKANYSVYKDHRALKPLFAPINVVGSGPNVFLLPGGAHISFADESAAFVVSLKDGKQKKYQLINSPHKYPFVDVSWRVPYGYETFYGSSPAKGFFAAGRSAIEHFDARGVKSIRLSEVCDRYFYPVLVSGIGEKLDGFCAPRWPQKGKVELLSESIPRFSESSIESFGLFYKAQALFTAGFMPAAIKVANEAVVLLGSEIDSNLLLRWLDKWDAKDRFPYAAGKLALEVKRRSKEQDPGRPTLTWFAAYNHYVFSALTANQNALAMFAAEEALKKETDERLCSTLSTSKDPRAEECLRHRRVLSGRLLLARLELGEITLDEFFNELAIQQTLIGLVRSALKNRTYSALWQRLRKETEKLAFLYRLAGLEDDISAEDIEREVTLEIKPMSSPYVTLQGQLVPMVRAPDVVLDSSGINPSQQRIESASEIPNSSSGQEREGKSIGGATLIE